MEFQETQKKFFWDLELLKRARKLNRGYKYTGLAAMLAPLRCPRYFDSDEEEDEKVPTTSTSSSVKTTTTTSAVGPLQKTSTFSISAPTHSNVNAQVEPMEGHSSLASYSHHHQPQLHHQQHPSQLPPQHSHQHEKNFQSPQSTNHQYYPQRQLYGDAGSSNSGGQIQQMTVYGNDYDQHHQTASTSSAGQQQQHQQQQPHHHHQFHHQSSFDSQQSQHTVRYEQMPNSAPPQQRNFVPQYPVKVVDASQAHAQPNRAVSGPSPTKQLHLPSSSHSTPPSAPPVMAPRKTPPSFLKRQPDAQEQQRVDFEVARNVSQIMSKNGMKVTQQTEISPPKQLPPLAPIPSAKSTVFQCPNCNRNLANARNLQRHRQSCGSLTISSTPLPIQQNTKQQAAPQLAAMLQRSSPAPCASAPPTQALSASSATTPNSISSFQHHNSSGNLGLNYSSAPPSNQHHNPLYSPHEILMGDPNAMLSDGFDFKDDPMLYQGPSGHSDSLWSRDDSFHSEPQSASHDHIDLSDPLGFHDPLNDPLGHHLDSFGSDQHKETPRDFHEPEELTTLDPNPQCTNQYFGIGIDPELDIPLALDVEEPMLRSESASLSSSSQGRDTPAIGFTCEACKKTVSSERSLRRHHNTCKAYQAEFAHSEERPGSRKRAAPGTGKRSKKTKETEKPEVNYNAPEKNSAIMAALNGTLAFPNQHQQRQNQYGPNYLHMHPPDMMMPNHPPPATSANQFHAPYQAHSGPLPSISTSWLSNNNQSTGFQKSPEMFTPPVAVSTPTLFLQPPPQMPQKTSSPLEDLLNEEDPVDDGDSRSSSGTQSSKPTGNPLFTCEHCAKQLCSMSNLKRHRATCKVAAGQAAPSTAPASASASTSSSQPATPASHQAPSSVPTPQPSHQQQHQQKSQQHQMQIQEPLAVQTQPAPAPAKIVPSNRTTSVPTASFQMGPSKVAHSQVSNEGASSNQDSNATVTYTKTNVTSGTNTWSNDKGQLVSPKQKNAMAAHSDSSDAHGNSHGKSFMTVGEALRAQQHQQRQAQYDQQMQLQYHQRFQQPQNHIPSRPPNPLLNHVQNPPSQIQQGQMQQQGQSSNFNQMVNQSRQAPSTQHQIVHQQLPPLRLQSPPSKKGLIEHKNTDLVLITSEPLADRRSQQQQGQQYQEPNVFQHPQQQHQDHMDQKRRSSDGQVGVQTQALPSIQLPQRPRPNQQVQMQQQQKHQMGQRVNQMPQQQHQMHQHQNQMPQQQAQNQQQNSHQQVSYQVQFNGKSLPPLQLPPHPNQQQQQQPQHQMQLQQHQQNEHQQQPQQMSMNQLNAQSHPQPHHQLQHQQIQQVQQMAGKRVRSQSNVIPKMDAMGQPKLEEAGPTPGSPLDSIITSVPLSVEVHHHTTKSGPLEQGQSSAESQSTAEPSPRKTHNQQAYICPECDKIYSCRKNVKRHRMAVHKLSLDEILARPEQPAPDAPPGTLNGGGRRHTVAGLETKKDQAAGNAGGNMKRKASAAIPSTTVSKKGKEMAASVENSAKPMIHDEFTGVERQEPPSNTSVVPTSTTAPHSLPQAHVVPNQQDQTPETKSEQFQQSGMQNLIYQAPVRPDMLQKNTSQMNIQLPSNPQLIPSRPSSHQPASAPPMPLALPPLQLPPVQERRASVKVSNPSPIWNSASLPSSDPPTSISTSSNSTSRNTRGSGDDDESRAMAKIAAELKRSAEGWPAFDGIIDPGLSEEDALLFKRIREGGVLEDVGDVADILSNGNEPDSTCTEDSTENREMNNAPPLSVASSSGVPSLASPEEQYMKNQPLQQQQQHQVHYHQQYPQQHQHQMWNDGYSQQQYHHQQEYMQDQHQMQQQHQPQQQQQYQFQQPLSHQRPSSQPLPPMSLPPVQPQLLKAGRRPSSTAKHPSELVCTGCKKQLGSEYSLRRHRGGCAEVQQVLNPEYPRPPQRRAARKAAKMTEAEILLTLPKTMDPQLLAERRAAAAEAVVERMEALPPPMAVHEVVSQVRSDRNSKLNQQDKTTSPSPAQEAPQITSLDAPLSSSSSVSTTSPTSNSSSQEGPQEKLPQARHVCQECDKQYSSDWNLERHKKMSCPSTARAHSYCSEPSSPSDEIDLILLNSKRKVSRSLLSTVSSLLAYWLNESGDKLQLDSKWEHFELLLDVHTLKVAVNADNVNLVAEQSKKYQVDHVVRMTEQFQLQTNIAHQ